MKLYRRWNAISQTQAAEAFNLDEKTIRNIEDGKRVRLTTIGAIALQLHNVEYQEQFRRVFLLPPNTVRQKLPSTPLPSTAVRILPPRPTRLIGRTADVDSLRQRLIDKAPEAAATRAHTLWVYGSPGVGKSTFVAALAHDEMLAHAFPDGVLWTALGPTPEPLNTLRYWGRALGVDAIQHMHDAESAASLLRGYLTTKRLLLIIDDVWSAQTAQLFMVGGNACSHLFSTRAPEIAHHMGISPQARYRLGMLAPADGIQLLSSIAPSVVARYPKAAHTLVQELEGLPLAIQVAGHLLEEEAGLDSGINIEDLIEDLHDGQHILESPPPPDSIVPDRESVPTIAALLQRSTDRLDRQTRFHFSQLWVFAHKPATFTTADLAAIWNVADPLPPLRVLVRRGLLEPTGGGVFQIHALLTAHAKRLFAGYPREADYDSF